MKAWRQAETLVEQAQRVMRESKKLVKQRKAQLRLLEQFVDQRGTMTNGMLRDMVIRAKAL
jgi:hypothetical protein